MEAGSPPSAGWYDFVGWLDTNKRRVGMGAAAVALLAILVGFFVWQRGQRELEADKALSSVSAPLSSAGLPGRSNPDGYLKIVEEYPKTRAAAKALLRAGTAYFDQADYVKAQEQFQKLLRNHGDTVWVSPAVFGIAASLEAQGKSADAIARFSDFISKYPSDPATEQARFHLAHVYEQTQQPALALDVLKKMTDPTVPSLGMQEAQEKIRELYARNPSLIPAPPTAPPQVPQSVLTNILRVPTNPMPRSNVVLLTNLIQRTNLPANTTGAAPRILFTPPNTNAAK